MSETDESALNSVLRAASTILKSKTNETDAPETLPKENHVALSEFESSLPLEPFSSSPPSDSLLGILNDSTSSIEDEFEDIGQQENQTLESCGSSSEENEQPETAQDPSTMETTEVDEASALDAPIEATTKYLHSSLSEVQEESDLPREEQSSISGDIAVEPAEATIGEEKTISEETMQEETSPNCLEIDSSTCEDINCEECSESMPHVEKTLSSHGADENTIFSVGSVPSIIECATTPLVSPAESDNVIKGQIEETIVTEEFAQCSEVEEISDLDESKETVSESLENEPPESNVSTEHVESTHSPMEPFQDTSVMVEIREDFTFEGTCEEDHDEVVPEAEEPVLASQDLKPTQHVLSPSAIEEAVTREDEIGENEEFTEEESLNFESDTDSVESSEVEQILASVHKPQVEEVNSSTTTKNVRKTPFTVDLKQIQEKILETTEEKEDIHIEEMSEREKRVYASLEGDYAVYEDSIKEELRQLSETIEKQKQRVFGSVEEQEIIESLPVQNSTIVSTPRSLDSSLFLLPPEQKPLLDNTDSLLICQLLEEFENNRLTLLNQFNFKGVRELDINIRKTLLKKLMEMEELFREYYNDRRLTILNLKEDMKDEISELWNRNFEKYDRLSEGVLKDIAERHSMELLVTADRLRKIYLKKRPSTTISANMEIDDCVLEIKDFTMYFDRQELHISKKIAVIESKQNQEMQGMKRKLENGRKEMSQYEKDDLKKVETKACLLFKDFEKKFSNILHHILQFKEKYSYSHMEKITKGMILPEEVGESLNVNLSLDFFFTIPDKINQLLQNMDKGETDMLQETYLIIRQLGKRLQDEVEEPIFPRTPIPSPTKPKKNFSSNSPQQLSTTRVRSLSALVQPERLLMPPSPKKQSPNKTKLPQPPTKVDSSEKKLKKITPKHNFSSHLLSSTIAKQVYQ